MTMLESLMELAVPLILIMFFVKMFQEMTGGLGLGGMLSTGMILRDRRRGIVRNDGTDRDYLSLVKSCKATKTRARRLIIDPGSDKDLEVKIAGRILGISPRLNFTAILIRNRSMRKILILAPTDILTTLDRPHVRMRCRDIVNYAELFWFPIPLRSSPYFNGIHGYWKECYTWIDEIGKKRISIDNQGDYDCQTKSAMRREQDVQREIKDIQPRYQESHHENENIEDL